MISRTRTPPDVKWLVVEIAALRGEVEHIDVSMRRLAQRKTELIESCESLERVAAAVQALPLLAATPSVHAHGRYGRRGALRDWLRQVLRDACPAALDTITLREGAIAVFNLEFNSSRERYRYTTDNLGSALRRLVEAGEIERVHDEGRRDARVGAWRWKVAAPSLDALRGAQNEG